MVLIIVALSFDILWAFGSIPLAEIAVFIFVLIILGYGNLRGGMWEYPLKLGSFNLSIILLVNFYSFAIVGEQVLPTMPRLVINVVTFPIICLLVTLSLAYYLRESIDHSLTRDTLIGATLGYMISMSLVIFFGII
jgi:hypothetical protein